MTNVSAEMTNVEKIIVLDYGSQYNQLITRRIREFGVFSELLSHRITAEEVKAMNPKGIILSGGPNSVYDEGAFSIDPKIFELGIPVLGICYGMQLITYNLGGKVEPAKNREYGQATLEVTSDDAVLFAGTPKEQTVWMSHGDLVTQVPEGFERVGTSKDCPIAAIQDTNRNFYGIQFHAEVRHSEYGNELLRHFALDVCQCKGDWTMDNFIDMQVAKIREQVMEALGGKFGLNIIKVDAKDRFLNKLAGVSDPEKKRKIIGNEFVYVFDDEATKLAGKEGISFLAQGTLYTDVIESGTETAQTIKSHHNVGGLPEDMQFELIEPLNTLFKDEVRELGTQLGMPDSIVWRQPFPGPGLGIRVIGEITEEKLEIVRESDAILREEIANAGLDRDIWQYFTVLPGIRSVGVMGDGRTYDYTVGIRAVTSIDGMTADFARIPWDVLQKISVRIVNEVSHVNRIVYDITSKPPATVEWE